MFPVPVPQAIMSSVCGASRANCLDAGGCAAPTLLATDSRPHSVSKAVVWVHVRRIGIHGGRSTRQGFLSLAPGEDRANYQTVARFRVYSKVSSAICIG